MSSPSRAQRWYGLALTAALMLGLGMLPCAAQPLPPKRITALPEQGIQWHSLTAAQRSALAPLESEWPRLDAPRKTKWIDLAQRMPAMSAADRSRIQVRMAEWARMSPADRGRARLQFQEARQLSPSDRQEKWQAYQALPAEQRRALAARPAPLAATRNSATAGSNLKKNVAPPASAGPAPRTVTPAVVQTRPGATTSLVNRRGTGPSHSQAGLPKISASKGFVDPATLLPRRGAQGAAVAVPAADKASSAKR